MRYIFFVDDRMFSNLVLAGGGLGAITYLGCLKYLEQNKGFRECFKNICGVSSGSIFALCIVLNLSVDECKIWLNDTKNIKINTISIKSLNTLRLKYGLDDSKGIRDLVFKLLDTRKLDHTITFRELAKKFAMNLIVSSANLSKRELNFFSIDESPDMEIVDAIVASTAIPVLFAPYVFEGDYHVDAFIYDNFPINYFKDKNHTLGINLTAKCVPNDSFMNFLMNVFNSFVSYKSTKLIESNCVDLECEGNGFDLKKMRFTYDEGQFDAITDRSYTILKEFVEHKMEALIDTALGDRLKQK